MPEIVRGHADRIRRVSFRNSHTVKESCSNRELELVATGEACEKPVMATSQLLPSEEVICNRASRSPIRAGLQVTTTEVSVKPVIWDTFVENEPASFPDIDILRMSVGHAAKNLNVS